MKEGDHPQTTFLMATTMPTRFIHWFSELAGATLAFAAVGGAHAADLYPWRDHDAPFPFLFGNEIDTHQQTRQTRDGSLFGFFYVRFIATHLNIVTAAPPGM